MRVKVRLDPRFLEKSVSSPIVVEFDGSSLRSLAKQLPPLKDPLCGDNDALSAAWSVRLNGKAISGDKLASALKDGDEVALVNIRGRGCCY